MTVPDSTINDFGSYANNDQPLQLQHSSNQSNNERASPIDDVITYGQKMVQLKTLMNQLSNQNVSFLLPNVNVPVSDSKAVGLRGELCHTCLTGKIEAIFSFDRLESLVTKDHTCNLQELSKIRKTEDISNVRSNRHQHFISSFAQIISECVGSEHIILIAEELQEPSIKLTLQYYAGKILPQCIFSKVPGPFYRQRLLSKDPYIDLGRVSNNHWAQRASTAQDHKTILSTEELLDFLNHTKSSFGTFQVELRDALQHYFLLYINF
jgi:hypothetical protein